MSDHESHFSPCLSAPYLVSSCRCQCCSAHRQSIQFLIADLETERASAASAAEESLAMIMRLQREKSDAKLEAIQVRRRAEDQIGWYQVKVKIFEVVVKEKDVAILSLSTEIQDCKRRSTICLRGVNHQFDDNTKQITRQSPNPNSSTRRNISDSGDLFRDLFLRDEFGFGFGDLFRQHYTK